MSQSIIKGKIPIILLLSVALLCRIVGYLLKTISLVLLVIGSEINITNIISFISDSLFAVFGILSPIILLMYILFLYKKTQPRFYMAATHGIVTLSSALSTICKIYPLLFMIVTSIMSPTAISNSTRVWLTSNKSVLADVISIMFYFFVTISFLFLTISCLFKMKNKIIPAIILVKNIILQLLLLPVFALSIVSLLGMGSFSGLIIYSFITSIAGFIIVICNLALYTALLIFVLSNKTQKTLNLADEQDLQKLYNMSPKLALEILNENLDNGTISEDEYQSQREIILNKI